METRKFFKIHLGAYAKGIYILTRVTKCYLFFVEYDTYNQVVIKPHELIKVHKNTHNTWRINTHYSSQESWFPPIIIEIPAPPKIKESYLFCERSTIYTKNENGERVIYKQNQPRISDYNSIVL